VVFLVVAAAAAADILLYISLAEQAVLVEGILSQF